MCPMIRKVLAALTLLTMWVGLSWAQTAPEVAKPTVPTPTEPRKARIRLIGVDEVAVPVGAPLSRDSALKVIRHPSGAPEVQFYLVAVVSRQILAESEVTPTDLRAQLTYPSYSKVMHPVVVVVKADELTETDSYKVAQKDRYVTERYYFGVQRGQRDWTFQCTGCKPTKLLNFYVTLHVGNYIPKNKVRARLPGRREIEIASGRAEKLIFPALVGELEFVLDDGTRAGTAWRRVKPGQVLFAEFTAGGYSPVIPYEGFVKGLAIIEQGYNRYKAEQGKGWAGGGAYNLAPPGEDPVHCVIMFGGEKGYIESCEDPVTRLIAKFNRTGKVIEYSVRYRYFKVVPFGKLKDVSISKAADRIVGLATVGRYKIEGTRSKPSLWNKGILKRGVLVDPKRGRFQVQAREFGEGFYMLYGSRTK